MNHLAVFGEPRGAIGHEGGAVVEELGAGVSSVQVGDHVIPLYTPECGECDFCTSGKTNLCQKIRGTQGQGLMPEYRREQALWVFSRLGKCICVTDTAGNDPQQDFALFRCIDFDSFGFSNTG